MCVCVSLNPCIVSVLSQCVYIYLTVSLDEPIFIRCLTTFVYTMLCVMDLTFDWCHIVLTAVGFITWFSFILKEIIPNFINAGQNPCKTKR